MNVEKSSFLNHHYLLIRRLHSLSGVVPIGVYLFPHLMTNSSIMWGRWLNASVYGDAGVETFQHEVNFIHSLPALVLIEVFGLWLPIAFHAIVGIWFATSGKPNVQRYAYQGNWRYTLQRMTGYVAIVFIIMHIVSLRFGYTFGGLLPGFDAHRAASTTAAHFQDGLWGQFCSVFYVVGVLAIVFHFANGLWTAAITWGLTITVAAQKRWGYVCAMVGAALSTAAVLSIYGFATLDVDFADSIEQRMAAGHDASTSLAEPDVSMTAQAEEKVH